MLPLTFRNVLAFRHSASFIILVVSCAVLTDELLSSLVIPFLPVLLEQRAGVNYADVQVATATLIAVYGGALLISSAITGPLTDSFKYKQTPFMFGLIALMLSTFMFFIGKSVPVLIMSRAFQGMSAAVVWITGITFMNQRLGPKYAGSAMGSVGVASSIGELMGPPLGGFAYDYLGHWGTFAVASTFIVTDILLRLLLVGEQPPSEIQEINEQPDEHNESSRLLGSDGNMSNGCPNTIERTADDRNNDTGTSATSEEFVESTKSLAGSNQKSAFILLMSNFDYVASLWATFVVFMGRSAIQTTLPLHLAEVFSWGPSESGSVLLIIVVPSLLSPLIGRLTMRIGPRWPSCAAFVSLALVYTAIGLLQMNTVRVKVLFCFLVLVMGISIFTASLSHFTAVFTVAAEVGKITKKEGEDEAPSGQATGLMILSSAAAFLFGPFLSGPIVQASGWETFCFVFAVLNLMTAVLMASRWRKWTVPGE